MQKSTKDNLIFSAMYCLLVLWQMLLPGYILTLDMVFTPKYRLTFIDGAFYNALPVKYLLNFLNYFLSGWVVQKLMLVALFFCLFYLAVTFLPIPKKHYANYWAALLFSLNPFVYERLLAGHWSHLFAYAFLPPFFYYLLEFFKNYSYKKLGLLLLWIVLIGMFSLHFLVMTILITGTCFLFKFINIGIKYFKHAATGQEWLQVSKYAAVLAASFLIASSYWLVPYITHRNTSLLNTFDTSNQLAFKTVGDSGLETTFNILTLYGFWGEREPWANYFLWPKSSTIFWSIVCSLLFTIILVGIYYTFKNRRKEGIFFLGIGAVAFVLACGLGEGPFKTFNTWLFDNIGFWRGFRDTQKFSGLLAFSYAYFGGYGVLAISEYVTKKWPKFYQAVAWALSLVPILYTYTMLGGFARQLQPVWYPEPWYQANQFLNTDKSDFKALFLPWHQYMSLDFNNNLITANPAKSFFDKPIIQGENMEVGEVFSQAGNMGNKEVESLVLNKNISAEAVLAGLKAKGIKYIVMDNNLAKNDYLEYSFLKSDKLKEVHFNYLTIFEILL
jgi:hypothetical protein